MAEFKYLEFLPDLAIIQFLLNVPPRKISKVSALSWKIAELCRDKNFVRKYTKKYGSEILREYIYEEDKVKRIDASLILAVKAGNYKFYEKWSDYKGWKIKENLNWALGHAIGQGYVKIVEKILYQWHDIDLNDPDNNYLEYASRFESVEIVKLFLDKGMDPRFGLLNAIQHGHLSIVKLLLERGAKLNFNPNDPDNPDIYYYAQSIWVSLDNNYVGIAELLLDNGVVLDDYFKTSSIKKAAEKGNIVIVKSLLDLGADPTEALLEAANKGRLEIVELLLERGAVFLDAVKLRVPKK